MFSTLLELAGFAAIVAATAILGGLPAGLYAGGVCALLVGYATEDKQAAVALSRAVTPARRLVAQVRARREQRNRRRELAKAG